MYDEGPSEEDIQRFSSDQTGFCPDCGEEVWDDISQCPSCGTWLKNGTSHRDPVTNEFRKKMIIIVVIIILLGFFYGVTKLF
jgi:uncharacterized membrane protein YvbJ